MKPSESSDSEEESVIKRQRTARRPALPSSLIARVSPPLTPIRRARQASRLELKSENDLKSPPKEPIVPSTTHSGPAIEAGKIQISDHLEHFSTRLLQATRPPEPNVPRLPHQDFVDLYKRNQHPNGRHFVIHQHDHPVAGVHYDLRLQISETSSISFAIMYGLPGNANSRRLNRNATETRVHNLWNHLIETASNSTGSMLIWDMGEYSILPYRSPEPETDDSLSDASTSSEHRDEPLTESEKLHQAFQNRKIRLRLHGTRLPPNYTIGLRMSKDAYNISTQPQAPRRKRRRKDPESRPETPSPPPSPHPSPDVNELSRRDQPATSDDDDDENETTRLANAYPGATNSIGSIHRRTWYISLDRLNSGFIRTTSSSRDGRKIWVRRRREDDDGVLAGFEPFVVRGRDVEWSVVTGRLAVDVMADEGVEGFVGRGMWRAAVE